MSHLRSDFKRGMDKYLKLCIASIILEVRAIKFLLDWNTDGVWRRRSSNTGLERRKVNRRKSIRPRRHARRARFKHLLCRLRRRLEKCLFRRKWRKGSDSRHCNVEIRQSVFAGRAGFRHQLSSGWDIFLRRDWSQITFLGREGAKNNSSEPIYKLSGYSDLSIYISYYVN